MPLTKTAEPAASTPAELLANLPVLQVGQVAIVLQLFTKRGDPDRRVVRQLIRDGKLPLVDPSEPVTRWRVSSAAVRSYIGAA